MGYIHSTTKLFLTCTALLSAFVLMMSSCENGSEPNGGSDSTKDNREITIKPEREKLVRNPMMGWVLYAGIGNGLSKTFWQDYDNLPSEVGNVKVSDYCTTLYIRGAWSDFNPEPGVYIWEKGVNTEPARRFHMLVDGAKERDLKLAFTFVVDSRDKAYDFTPAYVKNADGIEGYFTKTGSKTVWSPYPDNKVFQQHYAAFVRKFGERFNNPDEVQFVSGQGLGKWGEYHTVLYTTNSNAPREEVFDFVTDLYASTFTKLPVIINYHRWIGTRQEWDGAKVDPDTERLLLKAINKGFSLRHDAFGMKTYYTTWERNFISGWRYKRPVIMEGGWVQASHGGSIKGDGYDTYADVRRGEFEEGKGAFVNMMDFRYNSNLGVGETYSWFNDAYASVKEFIVEGGYRLYPDRLSLPTSVKSGATVTITHRWLNLGWGYCPTNIPQWKDRFKIAIALLNKQTQEPEHLFIDQVPELCDIIKGTPRKYTFKPMIKNVPKGAYTWAIGIVDQTRENKIGIQISAKENITTDGWLRLFDVDVK